MAKVKLRAEVGGRIAAIPAKVGDLVKLGDEIIVVESMKMEVPIATNAAGRVVAILVKPEEIVAEGQDVAIIEA